MGKRQAFTIKIGGFFLVLAMLLSAVLVSSLTAYAADDDAYYKIHIDTGGKGNVTLSMPDDYDAGFITMPEDNVIYINKDLLENTYSSWDLGSCLQYVKAPVVDGYRAGYIYDRGFAFVFADPSTLTDWDSYYDARSAVSNAAVSNVVDENDEATVYINWFEDIDSMNLEISAPQCGDEIGEGDDPQIQIPDGEKWEFYDSNDLAWVTAEDDDGYWEVTGQFTGTVKGGDLCYADLCFYPQYGYNISPDMTADSIIVTYEDTWGDTCTAPVVRTIISNPGYELDINLMLIEVEAQHIAGDAVIENEVAPTCLEDGSHDEVIYCSNCKEELSRESIVDEALGHDWGEWTVTKEPQIGVAGEEQRVCRRDASHVQTREIDPLVGYTVSFDANGHGTAPKAQLVESGKTAEEPKKPTAEGFTFGGWYTEASCTNAFDFSTPVTADITLYAKWTKEEPEVTLYTITYVLNGGTLDGKSGTVTLQVEEGTVIVLPKPTRDGYTFDYWEGSRYDAGASYTVTGNHTFTAQWKSTGRVVPETGDNINIWPWCLLMCVSAAGVAALLALGREDKGAY